MIIAYTFTSDKEILQWLDSPTHIEEIRNKYPAKKYRANLNLVTRQVEIIPKKQLINN